MKDYITIHINEKTLDILFRGLVVCAILLALAYGLHAVYNDIYDSGYIEGSSAGIIEGSTFIINSIINSEQDHKGNELIIVNRDTGEESTLYFEEYPSCNNYSEFTVIKYDARQEKAE